MCVHLKNKRGTMQRKRWERAPRSFQPPTLPSKVSPAQGGNPNVSSISQRHRNSVFSQLSKVGSKCAKPGAPRSGKRKGGGRGAREWLGGIKHTRSGEKLVLIEEKQRPGPPS